MKMIARLIKGKDVLGLRRQVFFASVGGRYKHAIDSVGGMSGGCFYRQSGGVWRCTATTSSGWETPAGVQWNEARRWDSTTYAFFDAYGNWP